MLLEYKNLYLIEKSCGGSSAPKFRLDVLVAVSFQIWTLQVTGTGTVAS